MPDKSDNLVAAAFCAMLPVRCRASFVQRRCRASASLALPLSLVVALSRFLCRSPFRVAPPAPSFVVLARPSLVLSRVPQQCTRHKTGHWRLVRVNLFHAFVVDRIPLCLPLIHTHTHTHTHKRIYIHIYINIYICIYVCIYIHICVYIYILVYICMYTHTHTRTQTDTYTHTHTHTHTHMHVFRCGRGTWPGGGAMTHTH